MWTLLLVGWMLLPGCWALTGPEEIRGYVGGSLSVRCDYGKSYTDYTKFWCKKRYFVGLCSDYLYIEIPSSRLMKTKGRVSIADDRRQLFFTATIVNLMKEDSGTYQCGLEKRGVHNRHNVEVTVFPAPPNSTTLEYPSTTTEQSALTSPTESGSGEKSNTFSSTSLSPPGEEMENANESTNLELIILIPCILLVFILFLLAIGALIVVTKRRKRGAALKKGREVIPLDLAPRNNAAAITPVYSTVDHPREADQMGLYSNVELPTNSVNPETTYEEVHHPGQPSREEVFYTTVTISTPEQQQSLYANMEQPSNPAAPHSPAKNVVYSLVKQKSRQQD